jgi:uncharacterized protein YecT (DUF1311 family)
MALIKCPDCGTDVSDAAPACPKCGRPAADTYGAPNVSTQSPTKNDRKRSGTVSVTLSSFAVLIIGIVLAVCFVPALQIGRHLETSCQVNGLGNGTCQFTNTGWTPGSECVAVRLVNKQGGSVSSGPLCSGRIWPNDTAQRDVSIAMGSNCENDAGPWTEMCHVVVDDYDNDAAASTLRPAPPSIGTPAALAPPTPPSAPASVPSVSDQAATPPDAVNLSIPSPFLPQNVIQQLPAAKDSNGNSIRPKLVFASSTYEVGSSTFRYLLISYAMSGDCHACGASLTAAIFKKESDAWNLSSINTVEASLGEFGKAADSAEPLALGQRAGALLRLTEGGMGEFQSTATVVAPIEGKVVTVLAETIGEDDTGTETCGDKCNKWSGDLSVSSTTEGDWPEIQVKYAGVGQRDDKSYGSMSQTKTFKFDGSKYLLASSISNPTSSASSSPAPMAGDGPSFDCSTATDVTARAICGNTQLAQLDRQMANLYYSHTNYATDPAVRNEQREWIRNRNEACVADVVCLTEQFNQRIKQLQ